MTQHIAYFSARQHGISISVSRCSCLCWSYSSGFDLWVRGRVVLQSSDESACVLVRELQLSLFSFGGSRCVSRRVRVVVVLRAGERLT